MVWGRAEWSCARNSTLGTRSSLFGKCFKHQRELPARLPQNADFMRPPGSPPRVEKPEGIIVFRGDKWGGEFGRPQSFLLLTFQKASRRASARRTGTCA